MMEAMERVFTPSDGDGLCECGCCQPAPIATRTVRSRGRIKGQPLRFIRGHNSVGMDRSGPRKRDRYEVRDCGYETPCWIWLLKKHHAGYGWVGVKGRQWLAHRWYYEQANGPIPDGLQLDHLCRQKICVNPDHLEPVTPLRNARRGSSAKLTDVQAREIYARRLAGETLRGLASEFGVSSGTIYFIAKNGPDGPRNPNQNPRTRRRR